MITVLIGHRGVGKSTLLKKIANACSVQAYDLDETLESLHGKSVQDLCANGIDAFRELEILAFQKLISEIKTPTVIAVGAGFQGAMPSGARVVWIRRSTDQDGRIFLNRPRLTDKASPLDEYHSLFQIREDRYRSLATEVLQLPEGYQHGLCDFFKENSAGQLNFDLTLFPTYLKSDFIHRRLKWGVRFFELRSDLLSEGDLNWAFQNIPHMNILYSIRSKDFVPAPQGVLTDWPLEQGAPQLKADIISVHIRDDRLSSTLSRLDNSVGVIKLAVEINNFSELLEGHKWWLQEPKRRAFLPRSQDGKWQWYRSLMGSEMALNFIREDEGSALDQPFLWQAALQPQFKGKFAAVLGSPIHHSRTPMEHWDYFKQRNIPVVAIEVSETEFNEAMPVLRELGLQFAAVTSPLKNLAAELCFEIEGRKIGSVNTLVSSKSRWYGANTDLDGLQALKSHVRPDQSVGLWGGGGTRAAIETVFQVNSSYSARKGAAGEVAPDVLLWAVGRNREFQWPPQEWQLQMVVDLNYTENSPGLELAAKRGIPYVSGLEMFESQAEGQRRFWHRFL